jgi:hypothetical protein
MRDYTLSASNFMNFNGTPAPFGTLTIDFSVTFDDTSNGFLGALDSFKAVTDGNINAGPFSATPSFGYFQTSAMNTFPRLGVGGTLNGTNVLLNGTDDFYFVFDASAVGPTSALLGFTTASGGTPWTSWDATVQPRAAVAAVPEPATWAMMLGGFGVLGGALRAARRRQRTLVSFA